MYIGYLILRDTILTLVKVEPKILLKINMNEVKTNGSDASMNQNQEQELDFKALYLASEAEKAKLAEERDNYKTGLLNAKGKIEAEDPKETSALIGKMNQLEEEMKALRNSKNVSLGSSSSQQQPVENDGHSFSAELVKDILKINPKADLKKHWANYQKELNKYK